MRLNLLCNGQNTLNEVINFLKKLVIRKIYARSLLESIYFLLEEVSLNQEGGVKGVTHRGLKGLFQLLQYVWVIDESNFF